MIFKGEPGMYVKVMRHKIKGFYFDENGRYETDDPALIERMKVVFPVEEEEVKEEYSCKKCEYKTGNKGLLMAHYRERHKKGEQS